jgi:hypothetical protein
LVLVDGLAPKTLDKKPLSLLLNLSDLDICKPPGVAAAREEPRKNGLADPGIIGNLQNKLQ